MKRTKVMCPLPANLRDDNDDTSIKSYNSSEEL